MNSSSVRLQVSRWRKAPVQLPAGAVEFAVGDVHGLSGHLSAMLSEMGRRSAGQGHLTLLGDLCDRGPDSLGCYQEAFARKPEAMGFSGRTGLLGNHEIFMLLMLQGTAECSMADLLSLWRRNGADRFIDQLESIGLARDAKPDAVAASIRRALGPHVLGCVLALATHREAGNLLFVHAGLNPAVPVREWFARTRLECTTEDHFAWIRFPFFGHDGQYEGGRIVVHGHTPEFRIHRWKWGIGDAGVHGLDGSRLGLDGGSYDTGIVAGAEFRNGAYRIYLAG